MPRAFVALLLTAASAQAHPLGNFTINHLTQVRVDDDAITLRYILDLAEIPTFQARNLSRAQMLARAQKQVADGLQLRVDGRPVAVQPAGTPLLSFPPGQGGLKLTRIGCRCARPSGQRGASISGTAPAASAIRPSSPSPATARPCAPARPPRIRPAGCAATPPRPPNGHWRSVRRH